MGLKHGRIVEEDTPSRGAPIRRFLLDCGDHVYLPAQLAAWLMRNHSPAEELFFLERGWLGRTDWAGSRSDLRTALVKGQIREKDLGGFRLPPAAIAVPGWLPFASEDDHQAVGNRLDDMRATFLRNGLVDTASTMALDAWLSNAKSQGACLAPRADPNHGKVWCSADVGHSGPHAPACPACDLVGMAMFMTAKSSGHWG